ncbi:hypothetical protein [Aquipuribacter nitratireducens]|uniref:Signal transduction histidine kinase n=1 Tax=Aquipuribacter nitratireducens TaxID=650104 RepID=A0ABW0GQ33_9MICO
MIGQLSGRVVALATCGIVVVVAALAALSLGEVRNAPVYLLALLLGGASVVTVLLPWSAQRSRAVAVAVAVAVVAVGLLVVAVLPDGRPGYALWYPAFVWLPLAGLALRGFPVLAVTGAVLSGTTTVLWAWQEPEAAAVQDGLYRVVSPTAAVVVAVGIAHLLRQYGREVQRVHAEQLEAARLSAGAHAAEQERRQQLSQVELIAVPVLRRLRDGAPVDTRLATECRLLEAAVRDGIRGRHLVDPVVRDSTWAARSRGVDVTLLDDSGTEPGAEPPPVADVVRRCLVMLLEQLEGGSVTARLAGRGTGTVVVVGPSVAELAGVCRREADRVEGPVRLVVDPVEPGGNELVLTVEERPDR